MHEFNIKNGYITSGQSFVYNNLTVSGLTLSSVPANDDTLTQILARDSSGIVKYRNASSFGGGTFTGGTVTGPTNFTAGLTANTISATTYYNLPVTADTFVTGFSLSNNIITLSQNRTGQYSAFTISLSAYTGSSVSGAYLPLSGGTLTGGLVANSGVTANTISQTSYIDFNTGSTNPSQSGGRVFFDNTSKALSYYDIANNLVPIAMGQQLYTRVYNATGAQIDKGKVIAITGTTNGLPSAILAVNTHEITSQKPIGLAAENIPNNSEGLVLNNGILSGITLNTFANGDTLYLSDTVPGGYVSTTSSLSFTARTNEIGYVLQTGTTTGKIYVNINNEDSNLSLTDKERNILEGNVISGGVYEYTGMTQGTGATINVAYARGWIVRNTYGYATLPDVTNVYYTGGTNITLTNLATADATFILINSASTLTQQTTFPTPQERRENIFLGKVVHPSRSSITSINQTVDFDVSPMAALRDLWTPLKLINQGVLVSPHSTTLEINTSAGTLWGNGIGWTTNQLNPDSVVISGTSPTTFQYRTQLGPLTGGTVPTGNTTTIAPGYYDNNGVVTAVGGGTNSSTNQRVFLFPTGLVRIQLGQKVYVTLAEAVAGSQTEQFVEYSLNSENGILIGIISVNKSASNLSLAAQAVFNLVSKFGEVLGGTGGISTTTLQQAYDNSSTPEIVINATLDGLSIKNGTGNPDSTTNLLEGINAAGTTTSFIRADGEFSGTSFFGSGSGLTGVFNHVKVNGTTQFSANTNTFINFSGVNVTITSGANNTLIFSAGTGGGGTGVSGDYLPLSGGTVTGGTQFTGGLSANTISATTYLNLPIDVRVTGGTYSGGQLLFTNNTGGTFSITGVTASGLSANYYGSFSNTNNLPVSGANIATVWTYNTTEISNGIVVQNNSQIKVNNKGIYEFGYSPQIEKTQGTDATVTIWATVNGVPVARSSSTLGLVANSVYQLPFVSLIFDLNANDYVEFYFSSNSQYIQLTSLSGLTTPTRPDSPALIVVAKQIGLSVPTTLTGNYLPLSGGTVSGATIFTGGLSANTISATTYQGNIVTSISAGNNINVSQATGDVTVTAVPSNNTTAIQFNDSGSFAGDDTTLAYILSQVVFVGGSASYTVGGAVTNSSIIGGESNSLSDNINRSVIIGGTRSQVRGNSTNSAIIGGDTNDIAGFNNTVILGGSNITATASDFVYVPSLNINTTPTNDDNLTQVLVRDNSGDVKYRNASSLGGGGSFTGGTVAGPTNFTAGLTATTLSATTYQNLPLDIRTTGATYSNNTFTYTNNTGGTYNVLFNTVTGLTANTLSATTYLGLPLDVRVTGGTYSSGTATFTNNTGGTFNVTGFYTGATDVFVTGGTFSQATGSATFTNNSGGTFNVTSILPAQTGNANKFLQTSGTGTTWFDIFGTSNTWTTGQTFTASVTGTPFYALTIQNTSVGTTFDTTGSGILYRHNTVSGYTIATNSSSAGSQDRSIYNYSTNAFVWQSAAKNANSTANYIWLEEGTQESLGLKRTSGSNPRNQLELFTSNAGSAEVRINLTTSSAIASVSGQNGRLGLNHISPTSNVHMSGSVGTTYVSKSTAYTAGTLDYGIICSGATGFAITLPTSVSIAGREYFIKNIGTTTITLATTSSQTIDGAAPSTYNLTTQYSKICVFSDGANWFIKHQ